MLTMKRMDALWNVEQIMRMPSLRPASHTTSSFSQIVQPRRMKLWIDSSVSVKLLKEELQCTVWQALAAQVERHTYTHTFDLTRNTIHNFAPYYISRILKMVRFHTPAHSGTLIGLYMMKHMGFTARECIAWLRIVRPVYLFQIFIITKSKCTTQSND